MRVYDLERGMRCTLRNGQVIVIGKVRKDSCITLLYPNSEGIVAIGWVNEDLTHYYGNKDEDIVKVEDLSIDGYKTIWVRKEKKYTLRLPYDFVEGSRYLNYIPETDKFKFDTSYHTTIYRTEFTQEEIDGFPNQEVIKTLIKEEVER